MEPLTAITTQPEENKEKLDWVDGNTDILSHPGP